MTLFARSPRITTLFRLEALAGSSGVLVAETLSFFSSTSEFARDPLGQFLMRRALDHVACDRRVRDLARRVELSGHHPHGEDPHERVVDHALAKDPGVDRLLNVGERGLGDRCS